MNNYKNKLFITNTRISIEDDFDKILPDNYKNKPIDNAIDMNDSQIIIKEKPVPETNNSFFSKLFSNDK